MKRMNTGVKEIRERKGKVLGEREGRVSGGKGSHLNPFVWAEGVVEKSFVGDGGHMRGEGEKVGCVVGWADSDFYEEEREEEEAAAEEEEEEALELHEDDLACD